MCENDCKVTFFARGGDNDHREIIYYLIKLLVFSHPCRDMSDNKNNEMEKTNK